MTRSSAMPFPRRNRRRPFFEHRLEKLEARLVLSNVGLSLFSFEPTIAVNPFDGNEVVVANFNEGRQTLGISDNGGTTFSYLNATLPAGEFGFAGDDSLAFDSQGQLTWTFLTSGAGGIDVVSQQVDPTSMALVGGPVFVARGNLDKEWVAADANPSSPNANNVYTVWTDFSQSGARSGSPARPTMARPGRRWPGTSRPPARGSPGPRRWRSAPTGTSGWPGTSTRRTAPARSAAPGCGGPSTAASPSAPNSPRSRTGRLTPPRTPGPPASITSSPGCRAPSSPASWRTQPGQATSTW